MSIEPVMSGWILELGILILGAWAVWKTLPRTPNIQWLEYGQILRGRLTNQLVSSNEEFPKALGLLDWNDVKLGSERVATIVEQKLDGWIVVGESDNLHYWSSLIQYKTLQLPSETNDWMSLLENSLANTAERFFWVASGSESQKVLEFLQEPQIDVDWVDTCFTHSEMDVEANIAVPYFVLSAKSESCLTVPDENEQGWKSIDVIPILSIDEVELESLDSNSALWASTVVTIMICKRKESS